MSVSKAYRDYVMEQLTTVGDIRARGLFGEVGFMPMI
jgi:TfoX/Sxy family transcriptional regulator of competence genes